MDVVVASTEGADFLADFGVVAVFLGVTAFGDFALGETLRRPGVLFLGDGDFFAAGEAFLGETFFGDLPLGVRLGDIDGAAVMAVDSGSIGVVLALGDFAFGVTALGDLASGVGAVLGVTAFGVFTGVLTFGDFALGVTALGDIASGVGVILGVAAFGVFTGVLALGDFAFGVTGLGDLAS